jgi:hypothetical protein
MFINYNALNRFIAHCRLKDTNGGDVRMFFNFFFNKLAFRIFYTNYLLFDYFESKIY